VTPTPFRGSAAGAVFRTITLTQGQNVVWDIVVSNTVANNITAGPATVNDTLPNSMPFSREAGENGKFDGKDLRGLLEFFHHPAGFTPCDFSSGR
jgi:uncharacterized repeat protein (TIGR01451 family)